MQKGQQKCQRKLWSEERRKLGRTECGRLGLRSTMRQGERSHTFVMCSSCRTAYREQRWAVTVAGAPVLRVR